jgi:hypothetical protein
MLLVRYIPSQTYMQVPKWFLTLFLFANYAWVQHFIHHLAPTGLTGFVLANGSMSSSQSGEGEIRKALNPHL